MTHLPTKQESSSRLRFLLLFGLPAAIALLLDISVYRVLFAHPTHDQSWILYAANLMLNGTQLYGPKLSEVNPPLIFWLSTLPASLATLFHVRPLLMLREVVTVLIVLSAAWTGRILRAAGIVQGSVMTCFAFSVALAIECSTAPVDFAQREQLLVLLLLPYIVATIANAGAALSIAERIAMGIAGALAICLKPHQVLVVIGLELSLVWWSRSVRRLWRPELVSLVITAFAYLAAVQLATPPYLHQVVPILRDTYWAYGDASASALLKSLIPFGLCWLAVFFVWLWRRHALRLPAAPLALLVCSSCASIAYYLQHTEWAYHAIPQKAFLLSAAAWLVIEALGPWVTKLVPSRISHTAIGAAVLLFITLFLPPLLLHGHRNAVAMWQKPSYPQTIFSQYPPRTPIYIFSTGMSSFDDIFQDDLVWSSRYIALWTLPAIALNEGAEAGGPPARKTLPATRVQQLASLLRDTVTEDLHTWKPTVVLIEHCTPTYPCQALDTRSFDTLAWFLRSPAFSAEWNNYHRQQGNDQYDVYTRGN